MTGQKQTANPTHQPLGSGYFRRRGWLLVGQANRTIGTAQVC